MTAVRLQAQTQFKGTHIKKTLRRVRLPLPAPKGRVSLFRSEKRRERRFPEVRPHLGEAALLPLQKLGEAALLSRHFDTVLNYIRGNDLSKAWSVYG